MAESGGDAGGESDSDVGGSDGPAREVSSGGRGWDCGAHGAICEGRGGEAGEEEQLFAVVDESGESSAGRTAKTVRLIAAPCERERYNIFFCCILYTRNETTRINGLYETSKAVRTKMTKLSAGADGDWAKGYIELEKREKRGVNAMERKDIKLSRATQWLNSSRHLFCWTVGGTLVCDTLGASDDNGEAGNVGVSEQTEGF